MSPEEHIVNQVIGGISGDKKTIAYAKDRVIAIYRKNYYSCLFSMIRKERFLFASNVALSNWVSVKEFSEVIERSESTARRRLQEKVSAGTVVVSKEKRPFLYISP